MSDREKTKRLRCDPIHDSNTKNKTELIDTGKKFVVTRGEKWGMEKRGQDRNFQLWVCKVQHGDYS